MSIKILLADDHRIVRQGIRALLDKQPDVEVVGEAEDGYTAVRLAKELLPNVVVMDVTMPDLNGIDATRQIIEQVSNVKVIALSMHCDPQFVTEMLKSGASGYLLKDCAFTELVRSIRAVLEGKTYLSSSVSNVVVDEYLLIVSKADSTGSAVLTKREREVLQLLAEGKSTKQIALKLYISIKTAETHRRQIMQKLGFYSIAELTKYAVRRGLTSLEM